MTRGAHAVLVARRALLRSCRVGDQVLINDRNWRNATGAWTGSLSGYRTYLINHEVGHWLGLGHFS